MTQLQKTIKFKCNKSITVNSEKDNSNAIIIGCIFFSPRKTRLFQQRNHKCVLHFPERVNKTQTTKKIYGILRKTGARFQLKPTKMKEMRSIIIL